MILPNSSAYSLLLYSVELRIYVEYYTEGDPPAVRLVPTVIILHDQQLLNRRASATHYTFAIPRTRILAIWVSYQQPYTNLKGVPGFTITLRCAISVICKQFLWPGPVVAVDTQYLSRLTLLWPQGATTLIRTFVDLPTGIYAYWSYPIVIGCIVDRYVGFREAKRILSLFGWQSDPSTGSKRTLTGTMKSIPQITFGLLDCLPRCQNKTLAIRLT